MALPCGIDFHLQLVLLSYHPIFLRPFHFLKLVSFLGANRALLLARGGNLGGTGGTVPPNKFEVGDGPSVPPIY